MFYVRISSVVEPELELEPEPAEPKLFCGTGAGTKRLLAISSPAPQLRSQNYLFNKNFTLMCQFGGCQDK